MSARREEFLTTREAAKRLGVALTTVQLWVETGVLPAWKTAGGHRRIPRKAVDTLVAEQSALLDIHAPTPRSTVLVVEDEPREREQYRLAFAEWQLPIDLLLAEDGFEGLLLAGRHAPDLVIADLVLPGMDSFRMIRQLRRQALDYPCALVVVTAMVAEEIANRGGLPQDIPVYTKPIPFPVLRSLIQRHLAGQADSPSGVQGHNVPLGAGS